jgi:hypothetical protein
MSCAADILAALDSTKPADSADINTFLNTVATGVAQAVVDYILASVVTACIYTGNATGSGSGAFTELDDSLLSTPFEAGLKATENVNNMIAKGFADGLKAMAAAGTVTESVSGVLVSTSAPITFDAEGSSHTTVVPPYATCVAALGRMSTEKPAEGADMAAAEQDKLKLMANSLAAIIDVFIPTIIIITEGSSPGDGSVGLGVASATIPAVDDTFPA